MVERIEPILNVTDLDRSLAFYVDVLGFKVGFRQEGFAGIGRDGRSLYLCQGGQGHPGTWVWVGVEDVRSFYEEIRTKGVKVRHAPQNYPWALEMKLEDPDGHVLRIGSEPLEGEPFEEFSS